MEKMSTAAIPSDPTFAANEESMRGLVEQLRERLATTALGGSEKSRERHVSRGKLLPRDRVDELLDEGSPFIEIAPLAANGIYDDPAPGAGVIAGIGLIHLNDIDDAIEDVNWIAKNGLRGGVLLPLPSPSDVHLEPLNDPCYDRLWAAIQDCDLVMMAIVGSCPRLSGTFTY